jgi:hypothetical protein
MKTFILVVICFLSLNLFAQTDTTHEMMEPNNGYESQNMQLDTAQNCLAMKNGKVVIMQNGKETALKKDTVLINGTKIKMNGLVIKKNGSKMMMKENECFNWEGVRMTNKAKSQTTSSK